MAHYFHPWLDGLTSHQQKHFFFRVPLDSVYRQPVEILAEVQEFVAQELASSRTSQELTKWSGAFHWIDDDSSCSTYFELQADLPPCMDE